MINIGFGQSITWEYERSMGDIKRIIHDEDIHAIDTTTTSTPTQLRGVITRAHARQLNQQE